MNESLLQKLKMVRPQDLGHVFLFLLALIPALVYKRRRPHLWLICEGPREAQDNAYWFFKYLKEHQPQVDAVYAIEKNAPAYGKVACLGETVQYGSFRHWVLYLAAEVNISSQKYGKPNAAVCYLLEVVIGCLKNRRVFLQHGVTQADLPFLYESKAKLSLFCCAAQPEYSFIHDRFGYPEEVVKLLGFCRFDNLHRADIDKNLVLLAPTWRMNLHRSRDKKLFLTSKYYQVLNHLLHSEAFSSLLAQYGKHAVFVMHRNMGMFEDTFSSPFTNIRVIQWQEADITALIKTAGVLITDYSSIFFDFAYMKKPVLYYQFDTKDYHRVHLQAGYFDYQRDGFGPVCETEEALLQATAHVFQADCLMDEEYRNRVERFYTLIDEKNCERTYQAISGLITK